MVGRLETLWHSSGSTFGLVCLISVVGACGEADHPPDDMSSVIDSAGVRIVSSIAGEDLPRWETGPTPLVEIGGASEDEGVPLFRVVGAVGIRDSFVVVGNQGSNELLFFDARGTLTRRIGGRGAGPGEFGRLSWIQRIAADSIAAFDAGHRRISIFDGRGDFVRSFNLTGEAAARWPLGLLADGSVLLRTSEQVTANSPLGLYRGPVNIYRYLPPTGRVEHLLTMLGEEFFVYSEGFAKDAKATLFQRGTVFALSRNGLYAGDNRQFDIGFYNPTALVLRIRLQAAVRKVDTETVRSATSQRLQRSSEQSRTELARVLREMPQPEYLPAFSDMIVEADGGRLWVKSYGLSDESPGTWWVFDRDGSLVASVELPSRFTPTHVERDAILGVSVDSLGVEQVQLFRLWRRGR